MLKQQEEMFETNRRLRQKVAEQKAEMEADVQKRTILQDKMARLMSVGELIRITKFFWKFIIYHLLCSFD